MAVGKRCRGPRRANGMQVWRGEVTARLDNIAESLDLIRHQFEGGMGSLNGRLAEHEKEDRASFQRIESGHNILSGKVAAVAVIASAIFAAAAQAVARAFGN